MAPLLLRPLAMKRAILFFLLPLAACRGDGLGQPVSQTVGTSGGQITITASQDPLLAGTQLVIPPGAVPDGTSITISRGAQQTAAGETALSPSVRLSPDGLVLARPATLFMFYPGQPANTSLVVEVTSLGKRSEQGNLLVSSAAGLAQMQINHFSDWQIVARSCDGSSSTDLAQPNPVDFASAPSDLGSGATDLAPSSSDLGSYDAGQPDLTPGWLYDMMPSDDGGTFVDPGYVAPATCADTGPVDLAVTPRG
jgi:hypothetical protein